MFKNFLRRGPLKIGTRLTGYFVVIVLLIIAADVAAAWQFGRIAAAGRAVNMADQTLLAVIRVHLDVYTFRDATVDLLGQHDAAEFARDGASLNNRFQEDVATARRLLSGSALIQRDPSILSALESVHGMLPAELDGVVRLSAANDWLAVRLRLENQVVAMSGLSSSLVELVAQAVSQERTDAMKSQARARRQLFIVVPISALVTVLLAVLLGWRATRSITGPLSGLEAGAAALARGDFRHRVGLAGEDELSKLGKAFDHAAQQLSVAEQERERSRHLEADLAHINRVSMLGELAASLSHELKQPIAAVMMNAEACLRWLKRDQPDIDEACTVVVNIARDADRAVAIINRLRSFYKQAAPVERELVDVNEVIREMLVLLRSEANRHAIPMRADLAGEVPKVLADRVQLQQVFLNLMLNGIEAMKETGGELTIASGLRQPGEVLIAVNDTGVGLPPGETDHIFDAFFTTKPQGSGMGLAISRSIVESHGGRLWATSNSGRGATFLFTLPTAAEERASHAIST
jgi:signal transduction histidine kinase